MNKPVDVQGYQPPSPLERRFYLAGLGGDPELIARTSTERFVYTPEDRLRKQLATLGAANALALHWSPGLRDRLVETLQAPFGHEAVLVNVRESSNIMSPVGKAGPGQPSQRQSSQTSPAVLEWTAVMPVRLGYHEAAPKQFQDPKQFATVLLITVDRGSRYEWRTAMHKALACRALLHRAHRSLSSVEVVVAACTVDAQASRSAEFLATRMDWAMDGPVPSQPIQDTMMPLLPFSGCKVTQEGGSTSGSMALVLRLSNGMLCGLTSRHVAVGKRLSADQDYNCKRARAGGNSRQGQGPGLTPSSANMQTSDEPAMDDARRQLSALQSRIKGKVHALQNRLKADPCDEDAVSGIQQLALQNEYMEKLEASLDDTHATSAGNQRAGPVLYAPKFILSRRRNLQDWALFGLSEQYIASTSKGAVTGTGTGTGMGTGNQHPFNQAYINKAAAEDALLWASLYTASSGTPIRGPVHGDLQLDKKGFMRLHSHGMPRVPPFASRGPSYLVGKRGPKTGLTFGLVNEIEAVKRVPYSSSNEMISLHMLILPTDSHAAFSAKGDSGSAIFDCNGCIVGMVDAGTRMDRSLPQPPPPQQQQQQQQQRQQQQRSSASRNKENVPLPSSSRAPQPPTSAMSSMTIAPANVSMDVTFATPIQWLLEDIQAFTGCDVEIA